MTDRMMDRTAGCTQAHAFARLIACTVARANARMTVRRSANGCAAAALVALATLSACSHGEDPAKGQPAARGDAAGTKPAAPTNRVDIPEAVRRNIGITFARVEPRKVAQTLRVPGRFELLPTARREYRAPLAGRVELMVQQYQRVEVGTPLYRIDAPGWRELQERVAGATARLESMGPVREAHRVHEKSLADKVALWQERLAQLEKLRAAGGGGAAQFTEARATLNATQAELADVMEKEAELQAQQQTLAADLRALEARRDMILAAAGCGEGGAADGTPGGYTRPVSVGSTGGPVSGNAILVCATAPGQVETLSVTPGGHLEEAALALTVVQPEQVRFRAKGMQSDMGRLRDGLAARIAPPQGGSLESADAMTGTLVVGLTADADERSIDLVVQPAVIAAWARAGVSASLEITLQGGTEELSIPLSAVVRDGATPIIFRRDPANPDLAIRMEADLGVSDGRWVAIQSGVKAGDEIVVGGNYQLMLATSGSAPKGGHFHSDGTFHEGKD